MNSTIGRMLEIELFGVPALMTFDVLRHEAVPSGMFRYELQACNDTQDQVKFLVDSTETGFLGTVLAPVPFYGAGETSRMIGPGELVIDPAAGYYTPAEFEEKYLSTDCEADRFGKPD